MTVERDLLAALRVLNHLTYDQAAGSGFCGYCGDEPSKYFAAMANVAKEVEKRCRKLSKLAKKAGQ